MNRLQLAAVQMFACPLLRFPFSENKMVGHVSKGNFELMLYRCGRVSSGNSLAMWPRASWATMRYACCNVRSCGNNIAQIVERGVASLYRGCSGRELPCTSLWQPCWIYAACDAATPQLHYPTFVKPQSDVMLKNEPAS